MTHSQWCDRHQIRYYAADGDECPICRSGTVDDLGVEAGDGRGAEA